MTIGGWIIFSFLVFVIGAPGVCIALTMDNIRNTILIILLCLLIIVGIFFGMRWYYNNTASGQRAFVDQRSDLSNGMDRVINVYTANGDLIATYEGRIDIDVNDGGYLKFDFEGKRYIYYNCFIESIAEIE